MEAIIPDDKKATEQLANERTFPAWVRTGIAIINLGFVVAKFGLWLRELSGKLPPDEHPRLGALRADRGRSDRFGGLLVVLAAWRFHVVNRQIDDALVKVDRGMIVLVTVAIAALALLMMAYIGLTTR